MGAMGLISTQAKSLSLGGGTPTSHSFTYHIMLVLCISMFRFSFFPSLSFCLLLFIPAFPKHKKTKNISVVSLYLSIQYLVLVCLAFNSVCYSKIQKDFALFACFLSFLFQIRKHQKYLLFFFGFVKLIKEFSGLRWLELGFHFILFKPHK